MEDTIEFDHGPDPPFNPQKVIKQIIPADGWMAVYWDGSGKLNEADILAFDPLACWALLASGDVVGVLVHPAHDFPGSTTDTFSPEDADNFLGYTREGDSTTHFLAKALRYRDDAARKAEKEGT